MARRKKKKQEAQEQKKDAPPAETTAKAGGGTPAGEMTLLPQDNRPPLNSAPLSPVLVRPVR